MSNNHDRKSVPEENFSQQFDLANFLTAVESTSTKSLTSVEFFNSFSSKKNTPGFKESITETIQSSKVYNGNEADITHVYDAILASLGKPEQLFQQLLTKVNFTVDEALTLMSKIYPQNIDKVELFDDIFSAIQKYEKEIDLQPLKKAFRRGSPFYGPLFQAKLHEKFGLAIDLNIVNAIIIAHYETPLKLIEKLKEAKIELSGLTDYIYPQHESIKTILLNLRGMNVINQPPTPQDETILQEHDTTSTFDFTTAIQQVTQFQLQESVHLGFDTLKPMFVNTIRHLFSIFSDSEISPHFSGFSDPSIKITDSALAVVATQMHSWPTFVSHVDVPIAMTGRGFTLKEQPLPDSAILTGTSEPNWSMIPALTKKQQQPSSTTTSPSSTTTSPSSTTTSSTQSTTQPIENPPLFYIPKFQYTPQLAATEVFATPQQLVLFYASLSLLFVEYQRIKNDKDSKYVNNECKPRDLLVEFAKLLSTTEPTPEAQTKFEAQIIFVVNLCHLLAFFRKPRAAKIPIVVVGSSGIGKSHLYMYLCAILRELNIPFAYIASEAVVSSTKPIEWQHRGLVFKPSQNGFLTFQAADWLTHRKSFDPQSVLLVDLTNQSYVYNEWARFATKVDDPIKDHELLLFTFSSGGKNIQPNQSNVKSTSEITLDACNIFPYYFSPSKKNYNIGMIQLHLRRFCIFHIEQYFDQPSLTSQHQYLHQLNLQHSAQSTHVRYFGQELVTLATDFFTAFQSILKNHLPSSSPPISLDLSQKTCLLSDIDSSSPPISLDLSQKTRLLSDIDSTLINNISYQQLYEIIISHPIVLILSIEQEISSAREIQLQQSNPQIQKLSNVEPRPENEDELEGVEKPFNSDDTTPLPHSLVPNIIKSLSTAPSSPDPIQPFAIVPSFLATPKHFSPRTIDGQLSSLWVKFETELTQRPQPETKIPTLFESIHHFWHDLSIFNTFGSPTTRALSFLSSPPLQSTQQPTSTPTHHIITARHLSMLRSSSFEPKIDEQKATFIHQDRGYIKYQPIPISSNISSSTSFGFEVNYINTLLQLMLNHHCYLPFDGFNDKPITKVISYNNFFGLPIQNNSSYEDHSGDYEARDKKETPTLKLVDFFDREFISLLTSQPTQSLFLYLAPPAYPDVDFFVCNKGSDTKEPDTANKGSDTKEPDTAICALQLSAGDAVSHAVKFPPVAEQCPKPVQYLYLTTLRNPRLPFTNAPHFRLIDPICLFTQKIPTYTTTNCHLQSDHTVFTATSTRDSLLQLLKNEKISMKLTFQLTLTPNLTIKQQTNEFHASLTQSIIQRLSEYFEHDTASAQQCTTNSTTITFQYNFNKASKNAFLYTGKSNSKTKVFF